jgi:hypothetical protein
LRFAKHRVARVAEKSGSKAAALQIAVFQYYAGLSKSFWFRKEDKNWEMGAAALGLKMGRDRTVCVKKVTDRLGWNDGELLTAGRRKMRLLGGAV